jgi:Ca2+-binding RTX toxin-like protein
MLHHESLERRICLSTAYVNSAGTLIVAGSDSDDVIEVIASEESVDVNINGANSTFTRDAVVRASIGGLEGNDLIDVDGKLNAFIYGGPGNDTLMGGDGRNTLIGGSGVDTYDYGEFENGITVRPLFEQDAVTLRFGRRTDIILPNAASIGVDPSDDGIGDQIALTRFADELFIGNADGEDGSSNTYTIDFHLRGGNDYVEARPSNTSATRSVYGDGGDDLFEITSETSSAISFYGGAGNDVVRNEPGSSAGIRILGGGPGTDTVFFNFSSFYPLSDLVLPGQSNFDDAFETIFIGGQASDGATIIGTDTSEHITLSLQITDHSEGSDMPRVTLLAQGGNDVIRVGEEVSHDGAGVSLMSYTIRGGPGNDLLIGGGGDDFLFGEDGDDTLVGNTGRDRLYGGPGDDVLRALRGSIDSLSGGDGFDTAFLDETDRLLLDDIEELIV